MWQEMRRQQDRAYWRKPSAGRDSDPTPSVVGWRATAMRWVHQAGIATHIGPRLVWTISASTAYREPLMSVPPPQLN